MQSKLINNNNEFNNYKLFFIEYLSILDNIIQF